MSSLFEVGKAVTPFAMGLFTCFQAYVALKQANAADKQALAAQSQATAARDAMNATRSKLYIELMDEYPRKR